MKYQNAQIDHRVHHWVARCADRLATWQPFDDFILTWAWHYFGVALALLWHQSAEGG